MENDVVSILWDVIFILIDRISQEEILWVGFSLVMILAFFAVRFGLGSEDFEAWGLNRKEQGLQRLRTQADNEAEAPLRGARLN